MSTHHSLSAKWDIEEDSKVVGSEYGVAELTEEEVKHAKEELIDDGMIQKFRRQDKFYADPIYNNQIYCLTSFVPTKGAQPDEHGVFGFMKVRGTFFTQDEANQRAEWIIRNVDSYHKIQTAYTGKPFPVCADTRKYVKETATVEIRKKASETISEDIKTKREEEKREVQDIKDREKKLLESTGEDAKEEPHDHYTTLQVKKANLVWTYIETRKKMEQMKENILKARKEIAEMDAEDPAYQEEYYERYMRARKEAGLPTDIDPNENNFIKYMAKDAEEELGF
jgi:hypothetical protein